MTQKNAREDNFKWVCHSIRHVKQNKAKLDAISFLSETSALWIRDYCQKVL